MRSRCSLLPRSFGPLLPVIFACAAFAALAGRASAQDDDEFALELGETIDWLAPADAALAAIPADAPERGLYPLPPARIENLLSEIPGRPFKVVDPPPTSRAYWKVPFYVVLGLPRDLVDGVFGLVSYVPIINLPLVAIPYEIVPTQVFLRDPRDWHRWPGTANRRGHGFFPSGTRVRDANLVEDGKHDPPVREGFYHFNENWGYFPTLNSMKWSGPSKRKLAKYQAENERLAAELQQRNAEIEASNRGILDRQRAAREAAVAAIDAGNGREAAARMLPYHISYPADEQAHALLLNALALSGDDGPAWARPYVFQTLATTNPRVSRQAETLLAKSQKDFPQALTVGEALVLAKTRREDYEGALEAARAASAAAPTDPRRARLLFEAAASASDAETAAAALRTLASAGVPEGELAVLNLRQRVLEGKAGEARPALIRLVQGAPENAYYRYYLGVADLSTLEDAKDPDVVIQRAFVELERASLTAPNRPLQERAGRALSYVRSLAAKEGRQPREQRGFLDITGQGN